jgi:hypothetical protein
VRFRNQSGGVASVVCLRSSSYHVSELDCKVCDLALKFGDAKRRGLCGCNPAIERYDDLLTPSIYVKPFVVKSVFFNLPFN